MKEETLENLGIIFMFAIPLILMAIPLSAAHTTENYLEEVGKYDLWDAQCPFGHYWVRMSGSGSFLSFEMDSNLIESYTLKYLVGSELKTIIVSSTDKDTHLHLTTDNTTMFIVIYEVHGQHMFGNWHSTERTADNQIVQTYVYHIYVPDPKVI